MKRRMKKQMTAAVLGLTLMLGVFNPFGIGKISARAEKVTWMGMYYVAKNYDQVFKEPLKGTIKVISAAGNKYKVSKNKITITCKKSGTIKYKIAGKKRKFDMLVGGNFKDKKLSRKEYNYAEASERDGKKFTNMFDEAAYLKKNNTDSGYCELVFKGADLKSKDCKKMNHGVCKGTTFRKVKKKYPSWQDVGIYEKDDCVWCALYYDKKTDLMAVKGFVLDKKFKVKKIVWGVYKTYEIELQKS